MSKPRIGNHRRTGRPQGTFVYLFLADDGPSIFGKIGVAYDPLTRAVSVQVGCPLQIKIIAVVEFSTRWQAERAEKELHAALEDYSARGEWFRFAAKDRSRVNQLMRSALAPFASSAWPMRWTKMDAVELQRQRIHAGRVAAQLHRSQRVRISLAERDFKRHKRQA